MMVTLAELSKDFKDILKSTKKGQLAYNDATQNIINLLDEYLE